MAKIKRLIEFSEEQYNILEDIRQDRLMSSISEALRYCIRFTSEKGVTPAYIRQENSKTDRINRTPQEKAQEKVDVEVARLQAIEDKKKREAEEAIKNGERICRELGGKEGKDKNGNRRCTYKTYSWLNPQNASANERVRYLDELTDNDIETQYYNEVTKEPMPADQVMEAINNSNK